MKICKLPTASIRLDKTSYQGWAVETTPILTGGFNRLKPPQSKCQKVVNTGQYESEWLIENFKVPFKRWIEILDQNLIYVLFIENREKNYCFVPVNGTFHFSTDFCITVQAPNTLYSRAE